MSRPISRHVSWVGVTDWQLKHFHGEELSTHRGSSYNAYLIQDEKTALVDTVWKPYGDEFLNRLMEEVDLTRIDYLILQHNEVDHSGALPRLLEKIPQIPIYCTRMGETILRGQYHQDWNFHVVSTGDTLSLGKGTLTFIEAPMLHWPDTMFTYYSADQILFSTDAFGQHIASSFLFNDEVDANELMQEARKYYVNILNPFSPQVRRKLEELDRLSLDIRLIAPSHGVLWRQNPRQIVEQYARWAIGEAQNQITIVYDTMWESTRMMAGAIAEGIHQADPAVRIRVMNAAKEDKNDLLTEIFASKAVVAGCCTVNNGISYAMAGLLEMIQGLRFQGKKAAAFGSYGWSGEAVKQINSRLSASGFTLLNEGLRLAWVPDSAGLERCRQYGQQIARDCQS